MPELSTDRLRFIYLVSHGLSSIADLDGLVKFAAQRARELFAAEGCSLIMLDAARNELYFPVVSDVDRFAELRLKRLRFPADEGIAGWVLLNNQATIVHEADSDPRFYRGIDRRTKMKTETMLCAPLRVATGNIGVIQIINPAANFLTADDLEFLERVAGDIALACERARLVEQLRGEIRHYRSWLRRVGITALGGSATLLIGAMIDPRWSMALAPIAACGALVVATSLFGLLRGWWGAAADETSA